MRLGGRLRLLEVSHTVLLAARERGVQIPESTFVARDKGSTNTLREPPAFQAMNFFLERLGPPMASSGPNGGQGPPMTYPTLSRGVRASLRRSEALDFKYEKRSDSAIVFFSI